MASEPEADGEADFIQSRRINAGRLCWWGTAVGCVRGQRAETVLPQVYAPLDVDVGGVSCLTVTFK